MPSIPNIVGHGAAHGFADVVEPAIRGVKYDANRIFPNMLPDVDALIHANYTGYVSNSDLQTAAAYHGATISVDQDYGTYATLTGVNYPGFFWHQVYLAEQHRPTETENREMANRYCWSDDELTKTWKRYGYVDPQYPDKLTNLRYDIPGPSDLVRFSVRHVWEPDLLAQIGYDAEFPEIIDAWHRFKGLDYPLFAGGAPFAASIDKCMGAGTAGEFARLYVDAGVSQPTWARAYWWSHWVLPSPSQGYLMWQRLNPLRDRKWDAPEMEGLDFGYPDLELLLRANDYPPKYRPLLAAISRPIPGIRYARQFAVNDIYSYQDLYQWTQRQGYSHQDGLDITNSIWADAQRAKSKTTACKECTATLQAYEVGILSEADAIEQLLGYGLSQEQAQAEVNFASVQSGVKRAKEVVSAVRRQYLLGGIDELQASRILTHYGIVATRIHDYLADWTLERSFKTREIGAQKLVGWACKGLIGEADLDRRLANLGYDQPDRAGLVAEAGLCAATLAARAAAAAARQQQQQLRQQLQAQKQALAATKALAQMLAGRASAKDLRKWFCEGLIGANEVYQRLAYLQWPVADITRLISDCKSGKKPGPQPVGP